MFSLQQIDIPTNLAFSISSELVSVSIAHMPYFLISLKTFSKLFFELINWYYGTISFFGIILSLSLEIKELDFNLSDVDLKPCSLRKLKILLFSFFNSL